MSLAGQYPKDLKDTVYIDKAAMMELNLTMQDVEQMAQQPEKYILSNHLKRQL